MVNHKAPNHIRQTSNHRTKSRTSTPPASRPSTSSKLCFDSTKYLTLQKAKILERIKLFDKLYIEFGGKLIDDAHAARVLPGFAPDLKIRLLQELSDDLEVILCINANDIEKNKIRSDRIISYDAEIIRLINFLRNRHIAVNNVVITLYNNQKKVPEFIEKLKAYHITPYIHTPTKGYPTDVDTIVSDEGYGANPYIETTKPIVVVSAPGACSGKLATSLSQLYHEYKRGRKAGYAKFETFPVWDLPLKSPINIAYEAATADIDDHNMIDYFHLEKYGIPAVNYNRDLEVFPVLKNILGKIAGHDIYFSPTDMGVNVIGQCIINPKLADQSAKAEVIRRYYKSLVDVQKGLASPDIPDKIKLLMNELNISSSDRPVISRAFSKQSASGSPSAAVQIGQKFVCGRQTDCLTAISSTILNALKIINHIPDEVDLISHSVLEPIIQTKQQISNFQDPHLHLNEVLLALSICSTTNPLAKKSLDSLHRLINSNLHATYIIPDDEAITLNNLTILATSEPIILT